MNLSSLGLFIHGFFFQEGLQNYVIAIPIIKKYQIFLENSIFVQLSQKGLHNYEIEIPLEQKKKVPIATIANIVSVSLKLWFH